MELWKECLAGNLAAWKEMERYNKQDVFATEALYNRLRVWDNSVSMSAGVGGCRNCGGFRLIARGFGYTAAGKHQQYQCKDCGSWMRSGVSAIARKDSAKVMRKI